MQECFFEANLGKLIGDLSQYAPTENIYKLLFLIDRRNEPLPTSRNNIRKITKAIADMNERRLNFLLETGNITQRQYDIEHAIKVEEYKKYKLWSEECEIIHDGDCFLFKERNRESELYEFTQPTETTPKYEKK